MVERTVDDWIDPEDPPLSGPLEAVYRRAETGGGGTLLGVFACLQALGLPMPADLLLAAFCTGAPSRTKRFVLIAVAASVLGGSATYWAAAPLWETPAVAAFASEHLEFARFTDKGLRDVHEGYVRHGWWTALFAGLRPVAYHRHAFTAGVFRQEEPFGPFAFASLLSHALRFLAVGGMAAFFADLLRPVTARRPFRTIFIAGAVWLAAVAWGVFGA